MANLAPASMSGCGGEESVEGIEMQPLPAAFLEEDVEEGGHLCFVCLQPCETVSKCKCKGRYVHPACLLKWLETKRSNRCDVCLAEYGNMHLVAEPHSLVRPPFSYRACLLGCSCCLGLLIIGSLQVSLFLFTDVAFGNRTSEDLIRGRGGS